MEKYDVVVIGAGPGGYIAALSCSAYGLKTAIIEKEHAGGTCLNKGCIPTKAILSSAKLFHHISHADTFGIHVNDASVDFSAVMQRKDTVVSTLRNGIESLFKSYDVTVYSASAEFIDTRTVKAGAHTVSADNIIIATGSVPADIPGFEVNGHSIISSDHALSFSELPESVAILGGGVIGVEFATYLSIFGVSVTIIELEKQLLPTEDKAIATRLKSFLKKMNVTVHTGCRAENVIDNSDHVIVELDNNKAVTAEKLLVSVGRKRVVSGFGADLIGINIENGKIVVDEKCETSVKGIYAIGDVCSDIMLAHWASAQGMYVAQQLAGKDAYMPKYTPACVYSIPEIASFGENERTLKEKGISYSSGTFSFKALGKAQAVSETDGMVKIFTDDEHNILGASLMGENVTELVHEIIVAAENGLNVHDLGKVMHAHPTLSEAVMESAHDVLGMCMHLPKKRK